MSVMTFEGIVENGQIRLPPDVALPERAKVFVVVPGLEVKKKAQVLSPRLAHPEQAKDFIKEIVEVEPDASA
jgi:hypothetical protein